MEGNSRVSSHRSFWTFSIMWKSTSTSSKWTRYRRLSLACRHWTKLVWNCAWHDPRIIRGKWGWKVDMKVLFGIYRKIQANLIDGEPVEFTSSKQALDCGVSMVHRELNQVRSTPDCRQSGWGVSPLIKGLIDEHKMTADTWRSLNHWISTLTTRELVTFQSHLPRWLKSPRRYLWRSHYRYGWANCLYWLQSWSCPPVPKSSKRYAITARQSSTSPTKWKKLNKLLMKLPYL